MSNVTRNRLFLALLCSADKSFFRKLEDPFDAIWTTINGNHVKECNKNCSSATCKMEEIFNYTFYLMLKWIVIEFIMNVIYFHLFHLISVAIHIYSTSSLLNNMYNIFEVESFDKWKMPNEQNKMRKKNLCLCSATFGANFSSDRFDCITNYSHWLLFMQLCHSKFNFYPFTYTTHLAFWFSKKVHNLHLFILIH